MVEGGGGMRGYLLAFFQNVVKRLAIAAGLRAISLDALTKMKAELDRLRPLERQVRDDWVLCATGGPLGGHFTPAPIEHTSIVPRWDPDRRKPSKSPRRFSTPDAWEPYQEFAEASVPDETTGTPAILLTRDEAMRLGYRPWADPATPAHRHLSIAEG